tara:strand:- start:12136 stop:12363 length:228 start_codon:yes stop_codon:yes gene_type:complete
MGRPKISLLEEKPKIPHKCRMCGATTRKNKFLWQSRLTGDEIVICRDCAYKERFGTKNMNKAKKERILEQKEINQ